MKNKEEIIEGKINDEFDHWWKEYSREKRKLYPLWDSVYIIPFESVKSIVRDAYISASKRNKTSEEIKLILEKPIDGEGIDFIFIIHRPEIIDRLKTLLKGKEEI